MGQRQGQTSDPNFDPNYFEAKSAEKHLISYEIRCFMASAIEIDTAQKSCVFNGSRVFEEGFRSIPETRFQEE